MKSSNQNSSELDDYIEEPQRSPVDSPPEAKSKKLEEAFDNLIDEALKLEKERREWIEENLPSEPPNDKCRHAVLDGALIDQQVIPGSMAAGWFEEGFFQLLDFGPETLHVWTRTTDSTKRPRPLLLVEVSDQAHNKEVWKTLGSCWELAEALMSSFESMPEVSYQWVYHFSPDKPWDKQLWYGYSPWSTDSPFRPTGSVRAIRYWASATPILELLHRDDTFFLSARHLYSSVQNHWFCLICALQEEGYRQHPNHAPEIWERASQYPAMEAAVVQATRAAEAILGEPGNPDKPSNVYRLSQRWKTSISLDPEENFHRVDSSFIDYYMRQLFDLRDPSAHGLGEISSFRVTRDRVITAQCFAFLVVGAYLEKNGLSQYEAMNCLGFNRTPLRKGILAAAEENAKP